MIDRNSTRDALERVRADGNDMSRPMIFDFFIVAPSSSAARVLADRARLQGYEASIDDDGDGEWTCTCTIRLVPTFDTVYALEETLDAWGREVGGYGDGFGTFGNE